MFCNFNRNAVKIFGTWFRSSRGGIVALDKQNAFLDASLANPAIHSVAFFERAELTATPESDEILPVEYSDNYVTVFPGETVELQGQAWTGVTPNWVRVTGYNTRRNWWPSTSPPNVPYRSKFRRIFER